MGKIREMLKAGDPENQPSKGKSKTSALHPYDRSVNHTGQ